jgi:phosphoglycolate phosphatase
MFLNRYMMLKAIVFDLDGTLIESTIDYEKMSQMVRELLTNEGVSLDNPNDRRRTYQVIQAGEKALVDLGVAPAKIADLMKRIESVMNSVELEGVHLSKPIKNVHETLGEIKSRNLGIGIATRGCHEYAMKSMELTGINIYIDRMLARDDVTYPKPDPRHLLEVITCLGVTPDTVLYVGDSNTDLKTAEAANVLFVGYRRNEEWAKRLEDAGCKNMVSDLYELVKVVDEKL